jgi:flagellar hook-basal body complex protein FliE
MIPLITAVAGVLSALSSVSTLEANSASTAAEPSDPNNTGTAPVAFSQALNAALHRVDDAIATANEKAKAFASGNQDVSISDVMISLEQANIALQMAAAARDKVIAAYTYVMNMPV